MKHPITHPMSHPTKRPTIAVPRVSRGVWRLRAAVVLAPWGVVLATLAAGGHDHLALDVVLFVTALATAWRPDAATGVALSLVLVATWTLARPPVTSPWVLLAAAALVVTHVAALLASYGPTTMSPNPDEVRRWAGRAALAWAAGVPLWLLGLLTHHHGAAKPVYLAVTILLIGCAVAAIALLDGRRPVRR